MMPVRNYEDHLYQVYKVPEIVIGIARPQGADVAKRIQGHLERLLAKHQFHVERVDISRLIELVNKSAITGANWVELYNSDEMTDCDDDVKPANISEYDRIQNLMIAGDQLRTHIRPSVGAMLAIHDIFRRRMRINEKHSENKISKLPAGIAYVVRTLVQPEEVSLLRDVYGQRFFLIAIHEARESRKNALIKKIEESDGTIEPDSVSVLEKAERLIALDSGESESGHTQPHQGMNVVETIKNADVFVHQIDTLDRFVKQLFSYPHGEPTSQEMGMSFSYLASSKSSALGRHVGAALVSPEGRLLTVGCNQIAAPAGGVVSAERYPDSLEHRRGRDESDVNRISVLYGFIKALCSVGSKLNQHTENEHGNVSETELEIIERLKNLEFTRTDARRLVGIREIRSTRLLNLIEFSRCVHAEMDVILTAARHGISTRGCDLYVTTYPCHECARNIASAGIVRVIFVEPYIKSLTSDLQADSVEILDVPLKLTYPSSADSIQNGNKTQFAPFEGISPTRFDDLYSVLPQKRSLEEIGCDLSYAEGGVIGWSDNCPILRQSVIGLGRMGEYSEGAFKESIVTIEQVIMAQLVDEVARFLESLEEDEE